MLWEMEDLIKELQKNGYCCVYLSCSIANKDSGVRHWGENLLDHKEAVE